MSGSVVSACRSCGSDRLVEVLDLGSTPIANALLDADIPSATYPLGISFCKECALVQLGYALPAEVIFDSEYPYYSSFSDALCTHAAAHVASLLEERSLDSSSLAVEVASNDGYLLRNFVEAGVPVLGIDPSPGPARSAEEIGVPTLVDFFGLNVARRVRSEHGPADVIVANNVMAHVPDLNDLVSGFAALLADDGVLTVENPWVRDLVEHVEFDTIYHEHFCYFSCSSVETLMRRHGLHLNDVEYFPQLHGGTLRWSIGHREERTERCREFLAGELSDGLTTHQYYAEFADRVAACQRQLRTLIADLRDQGRTVAAYGAAAKGATLLNSTGLGADDIAFVVDRNVHKQGKLMPGCNLPIRPVEALLDEKPDDLLLLAWNFASEIVAQQSEFAARGGRFYVPVPVPREITPE
ncbi:class I SAM-dependent methyltransferase [Ilumatobacter nonamiensis]|uniref:class I SAM-dependent methyltransferase n=1 Tax=Ilumatobacter nonamiensis TaxID=467093 RepID=UPI0006850259|nr:class I SAM-dependent methyltransferase [Ilumatobacter nonamiensis]